jgi:hypothetical protein
MSKRTNNKTTFESKKLILHFDHHNTIQVACTLQDRPKTIEQGLNTFLASSVWGVEDANGEWLCISDKPQIKRPFNQPTAITYFRYLEKKCVTTPEDRPELKRQTSNFVLTKHGQQFRDIFNTWLNKLVYNIDHTDDL